MSQPILMSFDSEDDSKGNPYLFNFYDGETHETFDNAEKAIEWLVSQRKIIQIWATNLQYDLVNLFYRFPDYCRIVYAGSRVISANIEGSRIHFRDTLNHWKISVAEMGKKIGLEKLNPNGNYNNIEYCRRDSEITYHFVISMREKYRIVGCKIKSTIGSSALNHFIEFSGFNFDSCISFDEEKLGFMEEGLYGGRTECFYNKPVKGNISVFDFNSLYPAVMHDHLYPYLTKNHWTNEPNLENEGMIHVKLRTPDNLYLPYLPHRRDGTLLFPLGNFSGTYTYFEIREALKLGYKIEKIYKALEFTGGTYAPFKKWVEKLYEERLKSQKENDSLLSDTYKLLMNNLFGKFGQSNERTELLPITRERLKRHNCTILEGKYILARTIGPYPKHSNFIWAAYTTAYARHRLYGALQEVISRGARLLYCDTDSIFFQSKGDSIFHNDNGLGKLKLEGHLKEAYFRGLKNYRLVKEDGTVIYKVRGVPRKYAEEFFENEFVMIRKPYRLREALRRNSSKNNIKNKKVIVPNYWEEFKKENRKIYDKRKVLKSGETKPIILEEIK